MIKTISTTPYNDQKMGTAGLRKNPGSPCSRIMLKTLCKAFSTPSANWMTKHFWSAATDAFTMTLLFKNHQNGRGQRRQKAGYRPKRFYFHPRRLSCHLKNKLDGGFVLSASHNPGGPDGDFGIKYSNQTGGQVPSSVTDKIYENTKSIREYKICDIADIDLSRLGRQNVCGMEIEIIDPVVDYVDMMQEIFDFPAIKSFCQWFHHVL